MRYNNWVIISPDNPANLEALKMYPDSHTRGEIMKAFASGQGLDYEFTVTGYYNGHKERAFVFSVHPILGSVPSQEGKSTQDIVRELAGHFGQESAIIGTPRPGPDLLFSLVFPDNPDGTKWATDWTWLEDGDEFPDCYTSIGHGEYFTIDFDADNS
jgi:hypothetical protein